VVGGHRTSSLMQTLGRCLHMVRGAGTAADCTQVSLKYLLLHVALSDCLQLAWHNLRRCAQHSQRHMAPAQQRADRGGGQPGVRGPPDS
jgi:hypothetical protein